MSALGVTGQPWLYKVYNPRCKVFGLRGVVQDSVGIDDLEVLGLRWCQNCQIPEKNARNRPFFPGEEMRMTATAFRLEIETVAKKKLKVQIVRHLPRSRKKVQFPFILYLKVAVVHVILPQFAMPLGNYE
jgi:hypothetical protein